ncbi:hypothetical protein TIFTF001_033729 [Ficus carica]|uniref:non-specific serine/threonine protein kinase n=1 Tax=Ficus carica TaxID=3494 RepID=A0AA88J455_FICCA|nr:hypothetical protein TIFTF001_033729 [Ficus carica]
MTFKTLQNAESTSRNCEPCGTTMIPYPLSTRPDCGDPLYFSFRCDNNSTGRVSFKASSGEYQVISIDQVTRKFVIQVQDLDNCEARNSRGKSLHLNQSLPFNVTNWCHAKDSHKGIVEIEIGWNLPPEPTCTSQANCTEWRHSTCTTAASDGKNDGKKRCLCNTNFQWDGVNLNCTGPQGHTLQASEDKLSSSRTKIALYLIVLLTVLSVIVLACVAFSFVLWRRKMAKQKEKRKLSERKNRAFRALNTERQIKDLMDSGEFKEDAERGIDVPFFDLESILAATNDFSDENKLGQGGYGPVYKGKFPGGQEIAIKRLSSVSGQGLQEFKNEVLLIARLQHRNLVRLRGYCMETRGLLYLHQDSRLRIIHRDLKTSNILLDQFMNPKISDFGLARMVEGRQTEANTSRVVGTYGYMAPEYALEGAFSVKSDVFSFGVVLLEIVSGKRNTRLVLSDQPLTLLGYAWRLWTENKVLDLMDQTLQESCIENQFIKCVNVGLLCVQEDPCERPNISNVITMLDSESAALPSPKQPAFVVRRGSSTASSSSKPETNTEITFSLEDGR